MKNDKFSGSFYNLYICIFFFFFRVNYSDKMFCGGITLTRDAIHVSSSSAQNYSLDLPALTNPSFLTFTFFAKIAQVGESSLTFLQIKTQPADSEQELDELNNLALLSIVPDSQKKNFGLWVDYPLNDSERQNEQIIGDLESNEWIFFEVSFDFEESKFRSSVSNLDGSKNATLQKNEEFLSFDSKIASKLEFGRK